MKKDQAHETINNLLHSFVSESRKTQRALDILGEIYHLSTEENVRKRIQELSLEVGMPYDN